MAFIYNQQVTYNNDLVIADNYINKLTFLKNLNNKSLTNLCFLLTKHISPANFITNGVEYTRLCLNSINPPKHIYSYLQNENIALTPRYKKEVIQLTSILEDVIALQNKGDTNKNIIINRLINNSRYLIQSRSDGLKYAGVAIMCIALASIISVAVMASIVGLGGNYDICTKILDPLISCISKLTKIIVDNTYLSTIAASSLSLATVAAGLITTESIIGLAGYGLYSRNTKHTGAALAIEEYAKEYAKNNSLS